MIKYLSPLDLILWFTIAAGQIWLAALALRRQLAKDYPSFALFVYFSAITTPILMVLGARPYFWAYYTQSLVGVIFMALSAAEIYREVYGPRISLPDWMPRNVAIWISGSLLICAIPVVYLHPVNGGSYNRALSAAQSAVIVMLCVSLLILTAYAKRWNMYLKPWAHGITTGLILCLTVNTVTMFLAGLIPNVGVVNYVQDVGQAGYLLALAWWGKTLWKKQPEPRELTKEMLGTVLEFHKETMEAARLLSLKGR